MDAIGTAEAPGHSSNSAYRTTAETDRIQTSPVAVEIAAPETQAPRGAGTVPSERRSRPRRADLVTEWPHVSVIIPTLNEAQNLPHVLANLPRRLHEVIVVDGFSTDDTLDVARLLRPDAKIVLQQCRGKGDALRCGFEAATGDALVMLDADESADPAEIPAFIETLMAGADFAKGTRFCEGGGAQTSPGCAGSATVGSMVSSTVSSALRTPTSATDTTPSGGTACPR
jgi:hypothetical protein